jgi:hypothetical protein
MDPIKDFLEIVKLAKAQTHQNLTLFPIMAPESGDPDYLTLEEALQEEAVVITEVSEGGHVPELKLVNRSESNILILDGEELKGAKQNRIVNATFLIGPKMEVVIPVSCVESGRWSYQSRNFDSGEKIMHFSLRRDHQREVSKNLREEKSFRSNQSMIWDGLADKVARMKVSAPTGAMEDLFAQQKANLAEYLKVFTLVDCQVGVVMAVNGEIAGIELFWYYQTFRAFFGKLVESYALDAIDWLDKAKEISIPPEKARKFLDQVKGAARVAHPSLGLGENVRLHRKGINGASLLAGNRVLHLSAFQVNGEGRGKMESRFQRYSERRGRAV